MMGDDLPEGGEITARWSNCRPGDRVRLIVDGEVQDDVAADGAGERRWTVEEGQRHWYLIEIRDSGRDMRTLTNPIFVGW